MPGQPVLPLRPVRGHLPHGGRQRAGPAHAVDGALALANMELLAHTMGLGALYCGFAVRAIQRDEALREAFGVTQTQQLIGCLLLGRTDLRFRRTAPRNPSNVQWK